MFATELLTARTEPHVDRPLRSLVTSVVYRTPTRSSGEHCPSLNLPAKKFELRHGVRRPSLQFGVHKMIGLCAKIARLEGNPCLGQENKPIKSWSNFGRTALPDVPTTTDRSNSSWRNSTVAITIYASSAQSAASERNFGVAMILIGTVFAGGQWTKSRDWKNG